jgi:6-phosphogluconolactonase
LQIINDRQTPDIDPCYVTVNDDYIVTASYSSGSIAVYERDSVGGVGDVVETVYHSGSSVNKSRQASPHVHQTVFTSDEKFLLACDLGTDKVTAYRYSPGDEYNILSEVCAVAMKSGSGPRHLVVNRAENRVYVLRELDAALTVLSLDTGGQMAVIQELSFATDSTDNGAAAIRFSPDERFVYVSNRGNANTITCLAVDAADGRLAIVEQIPSGGGCPRDFAITPDGRYIFVAHQYTNNIVIFARDRESGKLSPTGKEWAVSAPVCVVVY